MTKLIQITSHRARERALWAGVIKPDDPGLCWWPESGQKPGDFYRIDDSQVDRALSIQGIKLRSKPKVDDPDLCKRWRMR